MIHRRRFLVSTAAAGALIGLPRPAHNAFAQGVTFAQGVPLGTFGLDAQQLGVRAGSPDDQSRALQKALDQAAASRAPLMLAPGKYRAGNLKLLAGTQIHGVPGATTLVLTQGPSLLSASGADGIRLEGLTLDGLTQPLPEGSGLIVINSSRELRIRDCAVIASGRSGIVLDNVGGEITSTSVGASADGAIFSRDARGLLISGNMIRGAGNNGILVWRSDKGDDGTIVADNRIEEIAARAGGSGQNGNAVNVFRAANVIVRGNRIRRAAFSAVRGNAASNIQVTGNTCSDLGEVAIYAEFGFEGALIANNIVDGAALGVAVTNFNEGGRLAVVQGNLIRNLLPKRPLGTDQNDAAGVGIGVEADTSVTGNTIENAPYAGILIGFGRHLRDVSVTGNVVRKASFGIGVSVSPGAGAALIANNLIAETPKGAVLGMDRERIVTGDLAKEGAEKVGNVTVSGNRVR